MLLYNFTSGVRDWLGDPADETINNERILFFVLSALDHYAAQLYNAGKGRVEYKVTKNPTTKESNVTETFAFGQVGYVRRRILDGETTDYWQDVDIADSIADLNNDELRGRYSVFFYEANPMKMVLSWLPVENETLELWGEKVLFVGLALSSEVGDIPALFHHLVIENAARKAINALFTKPELAMFARETKADLAASIEKREIIWRNYLAGAPDRKRPHQVEPYNPLADGIFSEHWN